MSPAVTGRHCAACAKTVIDFTLKTDAELLAYFANPGQTTCGRFWADQLARPLRAALLPAPASRWRAWLAATAIAWSLREASGQVAVAARAVPPTHRPQKRAGRAVPGRKGAALIIRGIVRDVATQAPLPGVAVFLKGENRSAITDSAGRFSLRVPTGQLAKRHHSLVLHSFGYNSHIVAVPVSAQAARAIFIGLQANNAAAGVEVVGYGSTPYRHQMSGSVSTIVGAEMSTRCKPPRSPRRFFDWLSRPFRHAARTL
ncbi:carboxypeptidase-like regulatory domain-containing protein [Hymenobacter glaciei]|uniref:carboxypeptidase-like regulatory domain-containing protein n=1 Tax=Hymenobacter glaciei TaxID=877209 RepID=UPI003CD05785